MQSNGREGGHLQSSDVICAWGKIWYEKNENVSGAPIFRSSICILCIFVFVLRAIKELGDAGNSIRVIGLHAQILGCTR